MPGSIRLMISDRFDPTVIPGRNEGANPNPATLIFFFVFLDSGSPLARRPE